MFFSSSEEGKSEARFERCLPANLLRQRSVFPAKLGNRTTSVTTGCVRLCAHLDRFEFVLDWPQRGPEHRTVCRWFNEHCLSAKQNSCYLLQLLDFKISKLSFILLIASFVLLSNRLRGAAPFSGRWTNPPNKTIGSRPFGPGAKFNILSFKLKS